MQCIREIEEIDEVREVDDMYRRHAKVYLERQDCFEKYSNRLFKKRYRFSKRHVEAITNMIKDDLSCPQNNRGKPISPDLQVFAALRMYAKGFFQVEDGDIHGFSQPSMCRILKNVSIALARKRGDYVKFPITLDEQRREMQAFHAIAGFPRVIGCIDGTHIPIQNPGGPFAQGYINRKGFYSLNVQVSFNYIFYINQFYLSDAYALSLHTNTFVL